MKILSLLLGMFLGDACIHFNHNGESDEFQLEVINGKNQKDYINWKYKILKKYLTLNDNEPNYIKRIDLSKEYYRFKVSSYKNPNIKKLANFVLSKNRKRKIPTDKILERYFDINTLLLWYLDDGYYYYWYNAKKYNHMHKFAISCESFKEKDIIRLINFINTKFGFNFNYRLNKKGKVKEIYFSGKQRSIYFLELLLSSELIQRYNIPKGMEYKLKLKEENQRI